MKRLFRFASVLLAAAALLSAGGCNTVGGLVMGCLTNEPSYIYQGLAADVANPTHTIDTFKTLRRELTPARSDEWSLDGWTPNDSSWMNVNASARQAELKADRILNQYGLGCTTSIDRVMPYDAADTYFYSGSRSIQNYSPNDDREMSYTERLQEIWRRAGISIPDR